MPDWLTTALAIWGAVLSTYSLARGIAKSRGRLRVHLSFLTSALPNDSGELEVVGLAVVRVHNPTDRYLSIINVGVSTWTIPSLSGSERALKGGAIHRFPVELAPGREEVFYFEQDEADVVAAWCNDGSWRKSRTRRYRWSQLLFPPLRIERYRRWTKLRDRHLARVIRARDERTHRRFLDSLNLPADHPARSPRSRRRARDDA